MCSCFLLPDTLVAPIAPFLEASSSLPSEAAKATRYFPTAVVRAADSKVFFKSHVLQRCSRASV